MVILEESGPRYGPSLLTVDLGAIKSNYRLLAGLAGDAQCAAVVKANGYGLGLKQVSQALAQAGCGVFFVAHLDEAIELRLHLDQAVIYYLNGLMPGDAPACNDHDIRPVLNDPGQIKAWSQHCAATSSAPPCALQIDTGMARLGLTPIEARRLAQEPAQLDGIDLALIMSHLACADTPAHALNARQRSDFAALSASLPRVTRSLAASSGIFLGPEWHYDMVRPGAALYGVAPNADRPNPMAQVILLQGKILSIRDVDTPQSVGYGATYCFRKPTRLATVAAGYADGYPRGLGRQIGAHIGNIAVPVIGRISMDLITLDVTDAPNAKPGDMVDLIGPHHDLDAQASQSGTIGYEILTRIGRRYARRYIESDT
jgi:alanine racemase